MQQNRKPSIKEKKNDKDSLKGHRLRRNGEFRYVFSKGSTVANRYYVFYVIRKRNQCATRTGFSVSKKVGNAVVRNRVKRVLREVFRRRIRDFVFLCDIVVIARKDSASLGFGEADRQVEQLLRRAKLVP